MKISQKIKPYIPILIGIIYIIYFYTFLNFVYKKGLLISLKDVYLSNIGTMLLIDFINMLLFPLAIIIFYRRNLEDLGFIKSKLAIVLLFIYGLFFLLHSDYTIRGIYEAFFYLFIVALPEEIIYRGYIYNFLKKHNRIFAIIISGILFGIMHSILPSIMSESNISTMIKDMLSQIGGGILGGYIFILYFEKSNTILIPILIHALLDYSYSILGPLVAIIVLVYLIIVNRRNKEEFKATNKHLLE
ncbi:MAG: CPBP family intramembrane metalloprotease [Clostridium sp.]|uniref:CPBP family intramembrane glutamic endopeptidase n=1 Tax=Clostridium sp. TaxID=1506 RepID=UPI0025B88BA4|nr:CPBP family intramembrane glutamic endopeptidase [Clostridium sp.]MCF0146850.1 CPBP family intramembrane metalloprotease [Clostridium sp.]